MTVHGSIDEISFIDASNAALGDRNSVVPAGSLLLVRGWAGLSEGSSFVSGIYVAIDGGPRVEALGGMKRDDVARALDNQAFNNAGFRALLPTYHLHQGTHLVSIFIRDVTGKYLAVGSSSEFVIDGAVQNLSSSERSQIATPIEVDSIQVDGLSSLEPLHASTSSVVTISGWAVDMPASSSGLALYGLLESKTFKASYGHECAELVTRFRSEAFRSSGFKLVVPLSEAAPGERVLEIVLVGADGSTIYSGPKIRLDVSIPVVPSAPLAGVSLTKASIDSTAIFDLHGSLKDATTPLILVRGDRLLLRGWAVDERAEAVARAVHVVIDDRPSTPAIYGLERADVAASFGSLDFAECGFTALVSTTELPPGPHALSLQVIGRGGLEVYGTRCRMEFLLSDPA